MKPCDIKAGREYVNHKRPNYFRQVDMIVDSPGRPGGKVVAWSTDGFLVRRANGDNSGPTHGKCGIETFARWADAELRQMQIDTVQ